MIKSSIKIFIILSAFLVSLNCAFAVDNGYYNPVTNTRVRNSASGPVTTYYVSSPSAKYTRNNGIVSPRYITNPAMYNGGNNVIYRVSGKGSTVYYPNTGYYRNNYYPTYTTTTTTYSTPTMYYLPAGTSTTNIRANGATGTVTTQYSGYSTPLTGLNLINNGGKTTVNRFLSW